MAQEPCRLTEYFSRTSPFAGRLFTCARPGRSLGRSIKSIDDETVRQWVHGLPDCRPLNIISLLGRKPNGMSEYSYYSFRGGHDLCAQRPDALTFQEWLNVNFSHSRFTVTDFPTTDVEPMDDKYVMQICDHIRGLLCKSVNVLVVDSGGVGRTGYVCAKLGAKP